MRKEAAPGERSRRHRGASQWRTLVQAQERSGQSQEAFCRIHGISVASLSNWRRRLRAEVSAVSVPAVQASPTFIEIGSAPRPLNGGVRVRLELGAGIVLELSRA